VYTNSKPTGLPASELIWIDMAAPPTGFPPSSLSIPEIVMVSPAPYEGLEVEAVSESFAPSATGGANSAIAIKAKISAIALKLLKIDPPFVASARSTTRKRAIKKV